MRKRVGRKVGDDDVERLVGQQDTEGSAGEGKKEGFGEQLTDNAAAAGSDGGSDREFVAARGETSKPVATPLAFPNQHYNSTTSWGIDSKGEIKHVYA